MITESRLQRICSKRQLKATLSPVPCRRQLLAVTFLRPHASANLMSRSLLRSVSTVRVHRLTGFVCDFMKSLASTRRRGTPALRVYERSALRLIAVDDYRLGHLVEPLAAPADPVRNLSRTRQRFRGFDLGVGSATSAPNCGYRLCYRKAPATYSQTTSLVRWTVRQHMLRARTGQKGRTRHNPAPHTLTGGRRHQRQHRP
jgi:hypothetical protein